MVTQYVKIEKFEDFITNQNCLIEVMNHKMTGIESSMASIKTDVSWLKKLLWVISGMSTTLFISMVVKLLLA